MYQKDITISISGKDKKEVAKKIYKIQYLMSFIKNDGNNWGVVSMFMFFTSLFLIYVFFGVYITFSGIYTNVYLGSSITNKAYVYNKGTLEGESIILNKSSFLKLTNCGGFYCIDDKGDVVERPRIKDFVVYEFDFFKW